MDGVEPLLFRRKAGRLNGVFFIPAPALALIVDDPYYNPNLTRDREDFSESGDLRRLKEGRVTVRFRGGTLQ